MKFVHFFFIFGILLKGQYTSGTTLSSDFYTSRKLLAAGGAATSPELGYVFFSEKCVLTAVSADKIVGGAECKADAPYCEKPDAGACPETAPKLTKETIESGLHSFTVAGKGPGETTTESKDCIVVSYGREDPIAQLSLPATVKVEGDKITFEFGADTDKITKEHDVGAAVVCGGKLFAVVSDAAEKGGEAISVSNFVPPPVAETTVGIQSNTTDAQETQSSAPPETPSSGPTMTPPITVTVFSMLGFVFFTY